MRSAIASLAALTLASCSGASHNQHVLFARLAFDMPSDWTSKDSSRRGVATAIWVPDANDGKESVTVVRTELATAVAHVGSPALDSILETAATGLPGAHVSPAFPIFTKNGLEGVRVDVDYLPPQQHERYHRVHVVLVDHAKASLIHVLYTAKVADERLETLNLVLDTLREGEG